MTPAPLPLVILHPSTSFRAGLAAAFTDRSIVVLDGEGQEQDTDRGRILVLADGSYRSILETQDALSTVIVLVDDLNPAAYQDALARGADGVAHVDASPETIAQVAYAAVGGEVVLPTEIARLMAGRPRTTEIDLSTEDIQLLQRLSEGLTVNQLAGEVYSSERSLRRRLQNIYVRLGVGGRVEAMKRASQLGLLD